MDGYQRRLGSFERVRKTCQSHLAHVKPVPGSPGSCSKEQPICKCKMGRKKKVLPRHCTPKSYFLVHTSKAVNRPNIGISFSYLFILIEYQVEFWIFCRYLKIGQFLYFVQLAKYQISIQIYQMGMRDENGVRVKVFTC